MDIAELGLSVRSDGVVVATNRLGALEKGSVRTDRAATALTGTFMRLATVAGAALATAFSVGSVFAFQDSIAEASTLVDITTFSMAALEMAALDQASTFGSVQGQVGAFYDIISAGAGDVAQANNILTASNKLAIGGVTDIGVAADGLTSIMNAYGNKVEGVTSVSDALFVAMRDGKTTIGELSSGIGKVAPLAAQLNVEFDELVGTISALTKGGISTQESITGVRAVLAAVAKPTSEATKLANELGIEFNSTGLQAKGFQGFIEDLVDKTDGSTDALAYLFGGVEALVPVMALAGQAGKDFANIMDDMENKAGATEVAFSKMAASPGFQSQRLMSGLTVEVIELTGALGEQLVPVITLLADNSDALIAGVVGVTTALGAYIIATTSAASVTGLLSASVVVLLGPIGLISVAIGTLAGGYLLWKSRTNDLRDATVNYLTVASDLVDAQHKIRDRSGELSDVLRIETGAKLNAADAALELAKADRVATLAHIAYQNTLGGSQRDLEELYGGGNQMIMNNVALEVAQAKDDLAAIDQIIADIETQRSRLNREIGAAANSDPIGLGATLEQLREFSRTGYEAPDLTASTDSTRDAYQSLILTAQQRIGQMELEGQVLGMTSEAASRLRFEQDLLNQAASANIDLTPTQTSRLHDLAVELAATEEKTRALTLAANDNAAIWQAAENGVSGILKTWAHGGDVLDTLANKITGIADMLIDMAVRDLFMNAFGGGGGGGGIANLFAGLVGNASGTDNWRGGITAVNELGGEIMNLPKGTQIIPHDVSMRMASSQNQSNDNRRVEIKVEIANYGTSKQFDVEQISANQVRIIARDEISQYDRVLPAKVDRVARNVASDPQAINRHW